MDEPLLVKASAKRPECKCKSKNENITALKGEVPWIKMVEVLSLLYAKLALWALARHSWGKVNQYIKELNLGLTSSASD